MTHIRNPLFLMAPLPATKSILDIFTHCPFFPHLLPLRKPLFVSSCIIAPAFVLESAVNWSPCFPDLIASSIKDGRQAQLQLPDLAKYAQRCEYFAACQRFRKHMLISKTIYHFAALSALLVFD